VQEDHHGNGKNLRRHRENGRQGCVRLEIQKQPAADHAEGGGARGSLVSLAPDKSGKQLQGECSMAISTWPGKSIKAMPSGKAGLAIDDPGKIAAGDVQALAEAVVEAAMKAATKYMEQNPP
jgi:hypothetical protein